MMRSTNQEIEDEAARWVNRMSQPVQDSATAAAFDRWICDDPRHAESYALAGELWQSAELVSAMRNLALAGLPGNDNDPVPDETARTSPQRRRMRNLAVVAASLLSVCAAIPLAIGILAPTDTYASARGETRVVDLADGSQVRLSGDTRLAVRITPWSRDVTLERGEAFFDVAHEQWRRFSVDTGKETVTVLGTAFDIDLARDGAHDVRVYRGLVRVDSGDRSWRLPAGSGLSLLASGARALAGIEGAKPGWIAGWYDAEDTNLAQLIAHLDRVSHRPVVIADPEIGALEVTGRFRTEEPTEVLDMLGAIHGLQWHDDGSRYVLSR